MPYIACSRPIKATKTIFCVLTQEASPSAGKNTRIDLVPCRAWKCVPTVISGGVDISKVPGCHLLRQMSSQ